MRTDFPRFTLLLPALLLAPFAHALSGSGTSTTAPVGASNPGWANVGTVNGLSCVYLGSYETGYWVLTVAHVGVSDASSVTLAGNTFAVVAGSEVGFTTAAGLADLTLFRISGDASLAGLSALNFASSAPLLNSSLTMIGYGGGTKNWGLTTVSANNQSGTIDGGVHNSSFFQSYSTTVQAIPGDSGGGVFSKTGGQWYLTGLMQATGTQDVSGTTYYITQSIELADYATQIRATVSPAAVPEPPTYGLIGAGALGVAVLVRRRRKA